MYGLARGTITLIGAAVAGVLIWLATQADGATTGGYWTIVGLLAAAGLTMAFSQILGGWTKWGWPRISGSVFLVAFVPVLIAAGWVILAGQSDPNWFSRHATSWAGDIGLGGLLESMLEALSVLAFGVGLVFGLTFDTTGPRTRTVVDEGETVRPVPADDVRTTTDETADEPLAAERATTTDTRRDGEYATTSTRTVEPDPEPPPRAGGPSDT
ncbi:MAG: hypothetical protein M3540_07035 [Actinomycetota bacterium]|nr:hypothetical protein [Actinomycetota bacterium]